MFFQFRENVSVKGWLLFFGKLLKHKKIHTQERRIYEIGSIIL